MKRFNVARGLVLAALACSGLIAAGRSADASIQGPGFQEAGYVPIYELAISSNPNYTTGAPYSLDQSATAPAFDRVGYYLELGSIVNNTFQGQWISISFAAAGFTNDAKRIGVPTFTSGAVFQQNVSSMNVFSNVAGIVTGKGLTGGNVEFWPYNYFAVNSAGVPNASSTLFDWGDTDDFSLNYGSMQIANHDASQMLLSFNNWNNGVTPDIGIGNQPTGNPDWTFAANGTYQVQNLEVLVHPLNAAVPEPSTLLVAGLGGMGFLFHGWRRRRAPA
jgi:sialate O-acetylesterase